MHTFQSESLLMKYWNRTITFILFYFNAKRRCIEVIRCFICKSHCCWNLTSFLQETCISELGIYAAFLSDENGFVSVEGKQAPLNTYGGYNLRVKPASSDEGGVAAGYAYLSAPTLIDWLIDSFIHSFIN